MPIRIPGLHGAFLRADAVQSFGRHEVDAALARGEVLSPWRGVLVDPLRGADPMTIISAAWLVTGPAALVTGPSAAFLHGLTAVAPTPVHLVVPYETHKRSRAGLVVHNGILLGERPRRAARAPRPRPRSRARRSRLHAEALERARRHRRGPRRHGGTGTHADATSNTGTDRHTTRPARHSHRYPPRRPGDRPRRVPLGELAPLARGRPRISDTRGESAVLGIDGRELWRLDLGWEEFKIALEYNGYAAHADKEEFDAARRRDLERRGWIVVDAGDEDLHSGTRLEKELDEAFIVRGVDIRGRTPGALRPRRHRNRRSW